MCLLDLLTKQKVDEKFDVFCLGLLLLEVITLQEPGDVFHKLCKLIQRGDKEIIFSNI